MTKYIENLLMIYGIVAPLAVVIYSFLVTSKEKIVENEENENLNKKWKNIANRIMIMLVVIVAFFFIIFLALKKQYVWIFIPFTILTILERTNEAYASLTVIRETISSKGTESLSKRESDAIIMLAVALMMFNLYKVPQSILESAGNIKSGVLADAVTLIVLILIVTLYYFLIGVLLLITIKAVTILIRWIKCKIKPNKLREFMNKYRSCMTGIVTWDFWSTNLIEWTLQKKKIWRILWFLLFVVIPFDIMYKILCVALSMFLTIGLYLFFILFRLNKSISHFFKWLDNVSDRKIINIIFRSAFVISVSSVVIVNRYEPFLRLNNASTGVAEFLASAIVIPLIFAWIIDYKSTVGK